MLTKKLNQTVRTFRLCRNTFKTADSFNKCSNKSPYKLLNIPYYQACIMYSELAVTTEVYKHTNSNLLLIIEIYIQSCSL